MPAKNFYSLSRWEGVGVRGYEARPLLLFARIVHMTNKRIRGWTAVIPHPAPSREGEGAVHISGPAFALASNCCRVKLDAV